MSEKVKMSNIRDIENIPVKDSKGNIGLLYKIRKKTPPLYFSRGMNFFFTK